MNYLEQNNHREEGWMQFSLPGNENQNIFKTN